MKIEIYGSESCRFTVAAIAWCETRGYKFEVHSPNRAPVAALGRQLPQIFLGPHHIGGLESLRASGPLIQQILGGS